MSRAPYSLSRALSILVCLILIAAPAWSYIVVLKDGSRISTKEKYRIEGDRAILVLPSGTETSIAASEIDVEASEKLNVVDYGTAKLIEGLDKQQQLGKETRFESDRPTFKDLLANRERGLALPEVRRREKAADSEEGSLPFTRAGFVDLRSLFREPFPDIEISSEVMAYLKGQGIDDVRVYKGTAADRPFVEIVAASEASVFKALKDSANGLVQIRDRYPEQVAAFELLLVTEAQLRAGQFVLTPDLAGLLVTGQLEAPAFFLRYVEF